MDRLFVNSLDAGHGLVKSGLNGAKNSKFNCRLGTDKKSHFAIWWQTNGRPLLFSVWKVWPLWNRLIVSVACSPADNAIEPACAERDNDLDCRLVDGSNKVCHLESTRALAPDSTINHTALLVVDENCAACSIVNHRKNALASNPPCHHACKSALPPPMSCQSKIEITHLPNLIVQRVLHALHQQLVTLGSLCTLLDQPQLVLIGSHATDSARHIANVL